MKEPLKRRLVGAAVLASLAVILVPMLLDGRAPEDTLVETIPERGTGPFDEQLSATAPVAIEREPSTVKVEPQSQPASVTPPPVPRPKVDALPASASGPVIKAAPTPVPKPVAPAAGLRAWIVQVGSFSKADNANALAGRLRAAGFDTVIEKAEVKGTTMYRVQVGPEADRARADALLDSIRKRLKYQGGKVHAYPPA